MGTNAMPYLTMVLNTDLATVSSIGLIHCLSILLRIDYEDSSLIPPFFTALKKNKYL